MRASLAKTRDPIEALERVREWCSVRGIALLAHSNRSEWSPDERVIRISRRKNAEHVLWLALHECGHVLVDSALKSPRFTDGWKKTSWALARSRADEVLVHKFAVLEEELEAWWRGGRLARRLGIQLNTYEFKLFRAKTVRSYAKWTLERGFRSVTDLARANVRRL